MKKVAHVKIPYLPLSETFIYERIRNLKKYDGIILTARKLQNLHLFPYPKIYHLGRIQNVPKFLKNQNVKLIHSYFGTAGVYMLPFKLKSGLPMVTSFHGVDASARLRKKNYRRKLRRLFKKGELFFVVSNRMKRKLIRLGCPSHKIVVVKTGINFKKFKFRPKKRPRRGTIRIISVGRLVPKKGMDVLLLAFAKIHRKYPRTKLTIIGSGGQEKKLKVLRRRLKLRKSVSLLGSLPHRQVIKRMQKSHIFVLASRTARNGDQEGIPNAIIEAMALGLPVVSTRHSGIPEVVIHKKTGLLARPADRQDLAKKLKYMIKHRKKWKRFTFKAYRLVKRNHNSKRQIRKVESRYKEVIRRSK